MKEQIRQIIDSASDRLRARSLVQEYCQARILQFLQESSVFQSWIFHGGTALRFLYSLPRYSEDLDFAVKNHAAPLQFRGIIVKTCRSFEAEAYRVEARISERSVVKSAFIHFQGLLYELGLSPRQNELLSVKVEVDSHPPSGGITETSVVRRYVVLNLLHYDKSSFLSGKLHAILARPYVKGRDLYDLLWYLSDPSWPGPNIPFLNEAMRQTQWNGPNITDYNWAQITTEQLESIDWTEAVKDIHPFIERPADLNLLTKDNVLKLLKARQL